MTDLKAPQRFERAMLRLEKRYADDIVSSYREARARLQSIVSDHWGATALQPLAAQVFDALRQQVRVKAQVHTVELSDHSLTLVDAQFALLNRFIKGPAIDSIQLLIGLDLQQIINDFITQSPGWVDGVQMNFNAELQRLRDEELPAVNNRLFATSIKDGRASVYRNGLNAFSIASQAALWTAALGITSLFYTAGNTEAQTEQKYQKQVIAAIDERTTDTCLRVHGQIKDIGKPFELTGTPRYSDEKQHPPFHQY